MAKSAFIGRSNELKLLDSLWDVPRATLLILYGRRRVGKTRLLTHWLKRYQDRGLYWMAEPTSSREQLRSFSQALIHFIDPDTPTPDDFSYATWEQALRQVALHANNNRMCLFIDEVTYLIEVNPSFVGIMQKAWDHWLSDTNLMLALSGSQMGLMQKKVLAYDAPLYGRDSAQLKLPPMPFGATRTFFPDYSAVDRVHIYTMWGGVPAYWERLDKTLSVQENLQSQLMPYQPWMMEESRTLLHDFIKEAHNYVAALRAIADGLQSLGEIAKRVGLASNEMSFYLSVLRDAGFVKREVPISKMNSKDTRTGRYFITDPYLRFYYRFLASFQSRLALGQQQQALQSIEQDLPQFVENNTWQELCRNWLVEANDRGELALPIEHVGSEWWRKGTIDLVGIDEEAKNLILGDCFWRDQPVGVEEVQSLVKKTIDFLPVNEEWQVSYIIFSANGWTEEAASSADQIIEQVQKKELGQKRRVPKEWTSYGVSLVDLQTLDEDHDRWANT